MKPTEHNILMGGEAGQGLATLGGILARAFVQAGFHIHVSQVYESRIRGGHNTFSLRVGDVPLGAPRESLELLVALDGASIPLHEKQLNPAGLILCHQEHADLATGNVMLSQSAQTSPPACPRPYVLALPSESFADGHHNTVFLGAVGALFGLPQESLAQPLLVSLKAQSQQVLKENLRALQQGYVLGQDFARSFPFSPKPLPSSRLVLNGNEAIALGAMAAGVNFCSFYPMSPSTSIPITLGASAAALGIIVEQVEDEIAAVNMALGASTAGARAMTATSGGGLALMAEGISLAAITETPLVLAVAMRPGPATGIATGTEQADLNSALYFGHGEFPKAIFAPGTLSECFYHTQRAFQLAQDFQTPIFILTDQYLADSYREVDPFPLGEAPPLLMPEKTTKSIESTNHYERYAITESGISPRRIPGMGTSLVIVDSHEHTPDGHITEDPVMRVAMQDKRMRKLSGLRDVFIPPSFGGTEAPQILLVCWGSTVGAVAEAAQQLGEQGNAVGFCHFSQVFPLREETFLKPFHAAQRVIIVEGNSMGQFYALVRQETGFTAHGKILRYDGLPMTAAYIISAIQRENFL